MVLCHSPDKLNDSTPNNKERIISSSFLMAMIALSAITMLGYSTQKTNAQTSDSCAGLTVNASGVIASGSERSHPPTNAVDNKLNTRWSNIGLPSWIEFDLDSSQTICYVDIAWYRGNLRVNTFTISVSDDKINYEDILTTQNTGTTKSFERYNIPDTPASYLRITVTGNSENNNYASISEMDVYGSANPTPREICDNGIDDDDDGLIDIADSDCQQSGGGGDVDPFGIKKIYPTKSGGDAEVWYMDMNNPTTDSRTKPPAMTKNSDGSWRVTSTQVRYGIYTSSGYHPELVTTYDQKQLAAKGYMQSTNDWKNVEMTGYVKVNSFKGDDNFAWYNRGGRHTDTEPCEGTGYKGGLYYSGKTRFAKEQWHVSYVFSPTIPATSSIEDRWVGFKYVVYNVQEDGRTVVKMENWIDNNNDGNWVKIYDYKDSGGWGTEATRCGGDPDQIITWGGPIATFRWDSATSVDIKNLSVREIEPIIGP